MVASLQPNYRGRTTFLEEDSMRVIRSVLLVTILAGVACHDATGPGQRQQRSIFAIKVPPEAAVGDTIRISFHYGASPCDTGVSFESQLMNDGIRFVVSSVSSGQACPVALTALDFIQLPFLYIVVPPHTVPFTVRFAEPGAADSVRVIAAVATQVPSNLKDTLIFAR
jgi:hypothetical protein